MKTFSRPVKSGWKPAPSSSIEATVPPISTVPDWGGMIPASTLSSVLLPEPFWPTIATASPGADVEVDVAHRPAAPWRRWRRRRSERLLEGEVALVEDPEAARHAAQADPARLRGHQSSTAISRSSRRKADQPTASITTAATAEYTTSPAAGQTPQKSASWIADDERRDRVAPVQQVASTHGVLVAEPRHRVERVEDRAHEDPRQRDRREDVLDVAEVDVDARTRSRPKPTVKAASSSTSARQRHQRRQRALGEDQMHSGSATTSIAAAP